MAQPQRKALALTTNLPTVVIEEAIGLIKEGINATKAYHIEKQREITKRHEITKKAEVITTAIEAYHDAFIQFMYGKFGEREKVLDVMLRLFEHPSIKDDPEQIQWLTGILMDLLRQNPTEGFKFLDQHRGILLPPGD